MPEPRHKRPLSRRVIRVLWSVAAFFAVGYFLTALWGDARISMVAAALLAVPFGSKAPSAARGALRGACLGLVAGLAIAGALRMFYSRPLPPQVLATCVGIVSGMSASGVTGLDYVAGSALCGRLTVGYGQSLPAYLGLLYVGATVAVCGFSAACFALAAARRRTMVEEQWQSIR